MNNFFCDCFDTFCMECNERRLLWLLLDQPMFPEPDLEDEEHTVQTWPETPSDSEDGDNLTILTPLNVAFITTLAGKKMPRECAIFQNQSVESKCRYANSDSKPDRECLLDEKQIKSISAGECEEGMTEYLAKEAPPPACPGAPSIRSDPHLIKNTQEYSNHPAFPPLMPHESPIQQSSLMNGCVVPDRGRPSVRQQLSWEVRGKFDRFAHEPDNSSDERRRAPQDPPCRDSTHTVTGLADNKVEAVESNDLS